MNKISVALIGNPNVGKSTLFNALTGLNQHTGNWTGKTVDFASGTCNYENHKIEIIDLPGTYSLKSNKAEEKITTDYIEDGKYDIAVVICDSVNLEKSLILALQTLEITNNVILCLNLIDEASKKGIVINSKLLSNMLNIPVVVTDAKNKVGLTKLLDNIVNYDNKNSYEIKYDDEIEDKLINLDKNERYKEIKKIERDRKYKNMIMNKLLLTSKEIVNKTVKYTKSDYEKKDEFLDKLITNKLTGIPIMLLMLFFILWLTIYFSNYPSTLLFNFFAYLEVKITNLLQFLKVPIVVSNLLVLGVYKTVSWVIAVMLPSMAIFFPLFTILEDYGLLPRIAFNMDHAFAKCNACGKQCLTMLMGFGCNAVGVSGTKIIDSKKEKLIAILTNSFVPCNGRFPTIIAMIGMFFVTKTNKIYNTIFSAFLLTLVIVVGILMTLIVSKLLSKTIFKNYKSSFTLELPPYRRPKIFSVIIRSLLDKTLFILKRAVYVAIPAGIILYVLANVKINGISLLLFVSNKLNGFGKFLGLDGMIILAFLLGFPANEIVIPILLMGYLAKGSLVDYDSLISLKNILISNGWNLLTAINFIVITLFHFPCSTTFLTIKKETNSYKWSVLALILPTFIGIILSLTIKLIYQLLIYL